MTMTFRIPALALAAAAALALSACATGPAVTSRADTSVNFAGYRSFAFAEPLGTDRNGYQTVVSQVLKASARRELEARGLVYDAAAPQLIVNFNAALADKLRVTTTSTPTMAMGGYYGRGYYGYRGGMYTAWPLYQDQTNVTQYKEGTLNIDVADTGKKQLVWEGVVAGSVGSKAQQNLEATLDDAVTKAFARFPVARR
ncbi:MAG: hypothetical protein RL490_851 [Pseudomonadota bacterium]